MKNTESEQFVLLTEAVEICRSQGKSCLWRAEGLASKFNVKIPAGFIVSGTHVLVSHDNSCLIILICISKKEEKATIVAAGKFSSLSSLEKYHPKLFFQLGTLAVI